MQPYTSNIEQQMQRYYKSLSEKDRRRGAAIEALKRLLRWHQLHQSTDVADAHSSLPRRPGGGRKKALDRIEGLDEAFLRVVEGHTAGSPMDESLKWTHLTRSANCRLACPV